MRTRNSIRGFVRPSVHRSVRRSVGPSVTLELKSRKKPQLISLKIANREQQIKDQSTNRIANQSITRNTPAFARFIVFHDSGTLKYDKILRQSVCPSHSPEFSHVSHTAQKFPMSVTHPRILPCPSHNPEFSNVHLTAQYSPMSVTPFQNHITQNSPMSIIL